MNAELRLQRREKRGTEVQRYGTLNEAMKMWRNNLQFLHRTATHIFPHPFIPVLSLPNRDCIHWYLRTPCNKKAPDLSKPLLLSHTGYYSITLYIWILPSPCTLSLVPKRRPRNEAKHWVVLQHQTSYPISRCMLELLPITVLSPGVGLLQCKAVFWTGAANKHSQYIWWRFSDWALHNTFRVVILNNVYYPSMWYSTARSGSPHDALHLH